MHLSFYSTPLDLIRFASAGVPAVLHCSAQLPQFTGSRSHACALVNRCGITAACWHEAKALEQNTRLKYRSTYAASSDRAQRTLLSGTACPLDAGLDSSARPPLRPRAQSERAPGNLLRAVPCGGADGLLAMTKCHSDFIPRTRNPVTQTRDVARAEGTSSREAVRVRG
ncbi:hypothetical protein AOLI_G00258870 [Acnodon oligacanthus]